MKTERNYYEILGLPVTATTQDIKKRYRELARKYHPDVIDDKAFGARVLIQVIDAYKTLVDPEQRRKYDAELMDLTQPVFTQPRTQTAARTEPIRHAPPNPSINRLIHEAEELYSKRKLNDAAVLCKEALRFDPTNSKGHALLGDIYRSLRKYERAIQEYNYAVQYDPTDHKSQKKLERLIRRSQPLKCSWESHAGGSVGTASYLYIGSWIAAIILPLLVLLFPGKPASWISYYRLYLIKEWSNNLIFVLLADGLLVGFLLAVNGLIDHPDDEILLDSGGSKTTFLPMGLLVAFFSPIFFIGTAVLYLFLSFIQNTISPSIIKVFAGVLGIVLITALMYPLDRQSVLVFGGNVAFVGLLIGWHIGAIFQPFR